MTNTIQDLAAEAAAEQAVEEAITIPHDATISAMLEQDLLPAKLPEWQQTHEERPQPVVERRDTLDITPHTRVTVAQEKHGGGTLWIYFSGYLNGSWPQEGSAEERRNATLRFVLAEVEKALPVLRVMAEKS
ncbi:hypothetical protein M0R72_10205 [Candidatus Pacearchaeota archaeon]|jgi:hypothetical protein|nr:hypothetical protein [Candidatus Pacearchaeota archaeon]